MRVWEFWETSSNDRAIVIYLRRASKLLGFEMFEYHSKIFYILVQVKKKNQ